MKHAMFLLLASFNNLAGDNSKEATPDPIPNSVVKLFRVDGTAWVTVWESRSLPAFFCFCAVNSASAALSPSVTYRVPGVTLRSPRAVTLRPFRALVVAPLRGAFFVFDVRHCVGCEKMPQLRTLVRAWGIFSCLLEIARAKTKNKEITAFFVFDIRKP